MQSCRDSSRDLAGGFVWPKVAKVAVAKANKIPSSRLIVREDWWIRFISSNKAWREIRNANVEIRSKSEGSVYHDSLTDTSKGILFHLEFVSNFEFRISGLAGRSFQTIRDSAPFICFGHGVNYNDVSASVVTFMQLGIQRTRKGFRVVGND